MKNSFKVGSIWRSKDYFSCTTVRIIAKDPKGRKNYKMCITNHPIPEVSGTKKVFSHSHLKQHFICARMLK